jgi:predicted 3-demethylubiquinone-9 3-methyltransferase (glyoxalase superfamily)
LQPSKSTKISSFLWFESQAEQAVQLYASVFGEHCIPSGTAFELFGQRFIAFNGGPHYRLTEAFSIMVQCDSQAEIDGYYAALTADGGAPGRCGWLKDKFGLSWQIIPRQLFALLHHPDQAKASRVMAAMLGMHKLDIAALENA